MIGLLLRSKFQIWKNGILRGGRRRQVSYLIWYGLAIYLFVAIVSGTRELFEMLGVVAPAAAPAVLTAAFSGLITFALFWGVGSVLGQLYLNSDLELLLAAPLRRWEIFVLKLLEGAWAALMPALIALAALLGYGIAQRATILYYVWAVLALLALLAMIVALSMLLVMGILRIVPAKRARELLALVWVIFFGAVWFAWMMLTRRGSWVGTMMDSQATLVRIGQAIGWSPAAWLTGSLVALNAGQWAGFALRAVWLLAGAVAAVGLAYTVYDRTFYRTWGMLRESASAVGRRISARAGRRVSLAQRLGSVLPWPAREIALKDWTVLPRDLRWLSGLLMPIVVAAFYVYMLGFSGDSARGLPGAPFWLSTFIAPFVALFFSLSICVPALGGEGRNIGLLRAAPIRAGALLWSKVAATAPLLLLLSLVSTWIVAVVMGVSGYGRWLVVVQALWLSVLFAIAGVAAGGLAPDYRADHPRRAAGPMSRYAMLLLAAVLAASHLGLIAVLVFRWAKDSAEASFLAQVLGEDWLPFMESAWSPIIAATIYLASLIILGVVWRYSRQKLEQWQPTD